MLRRFYSIRTEMVDAVHERSPRRIKGYVAVNAANITKLQQLQDAGYVASAEYSDGRLIDFGMYQVPPDGETIRLVLNPVQLDYYENIDELLSLTVEEPDQYYLHAVGELSPNLGAELEQIVHYRHMLAAKGLLRRLADMSAAESVCFFAPEKLEIPFRCKASDLRLLPEIVKLNLELAEGAVEFDQRVVLFKKSLRDHLRMHPAETRFGLFLQNLDSIYDSYRRDYELWLGNTFADIKKTFEEKRLKFVADLNGVLSGIQASVLAAPIGAILVSDKYDFTNPQKNFLLASTVAAVAVVAWKLLSNQQHTLDSTKAAIDAVREDYEKQQPAGSREFKTRLGAVYTQEEKVRKLLIWFRIGLVVIVCAVTAMWLASYAAWRWPTEWATTISISLVWFIGFGKWIWVARADEHSRNRTRH
jgi:hypothetical protein